jgi:glucose/arabinose dehydrogenase
MIRSRFTRTTACALALASLGAGAGVANAQRGPDGPPPPPRSTNGAQVETLAQGVPTPTEFAFAGGTVFVAAAGAEDGSAPGGVFVVRDGRATLVPGSPRSAFGVAWKAGTLYVSSGTRLLALRGWDGTRFASAKTIYTGPKGFPGFNGLAIGPNGRIYAGVTLIQRYDHTVPKLPFANSILSLTTRGKDVRVYAKGLRQPFQLTFPQGKRNPYGTVLGQENLGRRSPPDYIINPKPGADYGFARCNWSKPKACKGFAKPVSLLPAHSSPMGIGAIGSKLYVALFGGTGRGPAVVSLPVAGGSRVKPLLTGFVAPVVALGTDRGYVYVGDLTGAVYRVKA